MTDSATSSLVGVWVSDPSDVTGLRVYGSVTVEFTKTGRLIYTIHGDEKDQIMLLTYSVETGSLLATSLHPLQSNERDTPLHRTADSC